MNNQEITFSVITVCYNAENCIERSLKSVAEQSYKNIEYLVIDGASKDRSLELVRQITPNAKVLSEPDKGIYDAMNKAIDLATGDYLCFINAGDAFASPTTLQEIADKVNKEHKQIPDIIYGDTELIDEDNNSLGLRRLRPPKDLSWRSFKNGMLVCHQSFYPKRELCPKYDLTYRFSADVDWCIRIMKEAKSYCFIDKPVALFLDGGTTTKNHRASLIERFHIMRKHYGLFTTLIQHIKFIFQKER